MMIFRYYVLAVLALLLCFVQAAPVQSVMNSAVEPTASGESFLPLTRVTTGAKAFLDAFQSYSRRLASSSSNYSSAPARHRLGRRRHP
ncbi:hypothetical protein CPB84DRAFT_1783339 [Gymnopilus junonius]|uniref:Uncharacterized protein n=1 Tax=Gymnopilus junonius TaxID=109634 RepID=A0A9P5NKJ0_GYMJU|nr:hypothetical protein CPB84DRAFT_1783339 [Gymnopilus junonius]